MSDGIEQIRQQNCGYRGDVISLIKSLDEASSIKPDNEYQEGVAFGFPSVGGRNYMSMDQWHIDQTDAQVEGINSIFDNVVMIGALNGALEACMIDLCDQFESGSACPVPKAILVEISDVMQPGKSYE